MIYGIFGDVHSNYEALTAVLDDMKNNGVEEFHCVGDLVGYAADPSICLEIIRDLDCKISAGNHDYGVAGKIDINNFTPPAHDAILWTRDALFEEDKDYLASLPLVIEHDSFTLAHGTLNDPIKFKYMTSYEIAEASFQYQKTRLCFVGHTHTPVVFTFNKGKIAHLTDKEVDITRYEKLTANTGSVGQPRDMNPKASYVIYDSNRETLIFKRVEYDIESAANKIYEAGLPRRNGDRLKIPAKP